MIRIGTRGSALARWQAEHVKQRLAALGHPAELVVITTTGDRLLDGRLEGVGGKTAFLKEIEEALLARDVDLAVHSLKDVPTTLPDGLALCALLSRADPRDALVSASGRPLVELPAGARVATSSLRRQAQLHALRPQLTLVDLRGNVDTRLRKLRAGQCEAVVLAMAGLERLGRAAEVTEAFDPSVLLPAPGQGVVALECRADDAELWAKVAPLHDPASSQAVIAERAFLAALGGGCNVPLAAFAEAQLGTLRLRVFVAALDGSRELRGEATGSEPEALGRGLAAQLVSRGVRALLT